MRAARTLPFILAISALGCNVQPKAVFVDIDSVLVSDAPPKRASVNLPVPPAPLGVQTLIQPPLPGRTLVDRTKGQIKEARRILEQDRLQAQKNLERRLRTIYISQVDATALDELAALKPAQQALLDTAFSQLFKVFQYYASQRGPLSLRLELLTNPKRHRFDYHPPAPDSPEALQEAAEVANIKAQIEQLDSAYDTQALSILGDAQDKIDRQLTLVRAGIEERKAAAGDRAKAEASSQVSKARVGLDAEVGGANTVHLPGLPGRKVIVPGVTAIPAPPKTDVQGLMETLPERRELLQQQLNIWLKINGWVRTSERTRGNDATQEFKQWRATYIAGH